MAANYQVNININAGVDFCQEFSLTNPDRTPMNITGCKFHAVVKKHPGAVDATKTTSSTTVSRQLSFITRVVDGKGGVFSITLPGAQSRKLSEGKYIFDVVMKNVNGGVTNCVGGLAFVQVAFASSEIVWDGGGATIDGNDILLDGGSASGY